ARCVAMAFDAGDALDGIEEPRLAADGEIESAVAVGDDVEARGFLRVDDRRYRIEILFAEQRLTQRRLERSAIQAEIEPQRPRIRTGDRGGKHHVLRHGEHWPDPCAVCCNL